jgi:hypothetical protein
MLSTSNSISRVKFFHCNSSPELCTKLFLSNYTPNPSSSLSSSCSLLTPHSCLVTDNYNEVSFWGFLIFAITHFVVLIRPFVTNSDESEGNLVVSDWAALHCPYRIPVEARLTAPFQTGRRTHPPSSTRGTGSLLRVKARGMALTTNPM